jgi:TonB family protein
MRTSLPPSERAKDSADTDSAMHPQTPDYLELCQRKFPAARRIAILSIIPGLGQLRNGELGKGLLFITVAAVNVALLAGCIKRDVVGAWLASLATNLHRQPNWDLATPFQAGIITSPVIYIYALLLAVFVAYAIRDAYDRAVEIIRDNNHPSSFVFSLPEATSGSYLAHFAIMAAFVLLVVCFITPMPPKEQVTVIELMKTDPPPEPPKPKPPAPKQETPKPKPVVQPKKVVVEQPKPVKVEPPKPLPVAVAVPTDKPTDLTTTPGPIPEAAPAPAPTPTTGTGGGSTAAGDGGGGGGSGDIDMGPYMRELQRKIKKAWYPPKGNESKRIKVAFKVHKDGTISKLKLVISSGVDVADEAATQAVENAAPFAPLPDGVGEEIDINFTFDYTVFSGGRGSFR